MPDSFIPKIIFERVRDEGVLQKRYESLAAKFPEGSVTNVPLDFLKRLRMDGRPDEYPECVVLCYTDGTLPTATPNSAVAKTYPTYKNMQAKRVAAIAKDPTKVRKGVVILQECGNIYCANQNHIEVTGAVVDTGAKAAETFRERSASGYYEPGDE